MTLSSQPIFPEGAFLSGLFTALHESCIRYAVLRNYETLPYSVGGSDLDILVHPDDAERAKRIIFQAVGHAGGIVLGLAETVGFLKISTLGCYTSSNNELLWWGILIDFFYEVVRFDGASQFFEFDWKTVKYHNGIAVVPGNTAAVLGVVKEVLYNSKLPERYLEVARQSITTHWGSLSSSLSPMGTKALCLFRQLLADMPARGELAVRCASIRKALRCHAFEHGPLLYVKRRASFEWSKLRRYIAPSGLVISVLGVDGSGKSTVINSIKPILDAATHKATFIQHLRPSLLPPLAWLKGKADEPTGPVLDPHSSTPSGLLGSFLRVTYLTLDYIFGYWLLIRPKIAKKTSIVLFDRYAYDMLLDPLRFRLGIGLRVIEIFLRLIPKPDVVLCLHAKPDAIMARKQELSLTEITRQVNALYELAQREAQAILVSTEGSVDEVRDQVLKVLMDFFKRRGGNEND